MSTNQEIELLARLVPFQSQMPIPVRYKSTNLKKEYVADLVCYGNLIIELKAITCLTPKDESQALNYLKATGFRVALLLNFGDPTGLEWKRFVR